MKDNYEIHIIVADFDRTDRVDLERIENEKFDSCKDAVNAVHGLNFGISSSPKPIIRIYSMTEFMDACNQSDDDSPKEERIDIDEVWIGYVRILIE